MMKRALAAALVCFSAGTVAMAADLPVSAAGIPPPWPRTWDWNGFYAGLNVGYDWGTARNVWTFNNPAFFTTGTDTDRLSGPLGGFQIGGNWHAGYFLFGLESDIDYAGQRAKQTFNAAFTAPPNLAGAISVPHTTNLNWLGTVRGRL